MADSSEGDNYPKTTQNSVRRLRERGHYDKETVHAIIDETLICHVGFSETGDESQPYPVVIPMLFGREEDKIYIHGSSAARYERILKRMKTGLPCTATFTLMDGFVLARSLFHHSMNYRSAVVFGTAKLIEDDAQKLHALAVISDHVHPQRWEDARPPNAKELKETSVIELSIESASAKIRTGPPKDDAEDLEDPKLTKVWAGVIPISLDTNIPIPDEHVPTGLPVPKYLKFTTVKDRQKHAV